MTNLRNEVIGYEKALTTITLLVFTWSTKSSVYQMTLLGCKCVCVGGGGGGGGGGGRGVCYHYHGCSIPGLCGKGQYPHLLSCFGFKIKICFLMTITTYQLASA